MKKIVRRYNVNRLRKMVFFLNLYIQPLFDKQLGVRTGVYKKIFTNVFGFFFNDRYT